MSMTAEELFAEEQRRRRAIAGVGAETGTTTGPRLLPPAKPHVYQGGVNKDKGGGDDGGIFQNLVASPIGWVSSQIANLPRFAMSAIKTGGNLTPGRLAYTGPKIVADYQEAGKQGLSGLDQFYYATSDATPLVSQLSQGIITSGGNIGELATLGKLDTGEPGINYANAYRSGNLGATILDDLGNVVLVGRGVGAGNVISRAGGKVTAAGAPRLGRAISGTGRFVEEPIGTTARTTARLAQPVAGRYLGRPLLSERLGRVAQAGIGDTAGPFRQAIFEANDAVTTRALSRLGRVNQQIADLDRQFEANPTEGGRLAVERQKLMRQQSKWTRISGLVRNIRGFTRQRQIQEEQRRASFISEGLRLQERGPSVEFEGAPEGPLPEFAEKVANLILTGRMDVVIRELRAGVPFEQVLQSINPSGIGPDLARQGYAFTADDLRMAVEYADGRLSDFDRLSVDAVVNFLRRFSDEFTAGQLSGEYRLGGPMPETYTRAFPLVEFLFSKDVRLPQVMFAALLDYMDAKVAELVIANLDPETLKENNISATVEDPQGAFKELAEVPKDSDLDGLAQILFEQFTPELMQRFPEIMRNPMIYPAPMRPAMMLEARLLRNAKAQDIKTILTGLNALIEQYGDLLGKNTVASIVANLENIVGTPLENTPGAYTQVTRQLAGIRRAIAERIAKLQERTGTLTAEQQTIVSNLIDAEQRLGAAEATLRTVAQAYDVLEPIPDEGILQAEEAVGVAQDKQATVQKAIDEYRRSQAELELQEDPRQPIIDEIDEAVRLAEGLEYGDNLDTLIDEFEFRQRQVESGKVDPTTVEPKPFTNRSKEVKAFRDEMLRVADDVVKTAFSRQEAFQPGQTISWNAWAVDSDNIFGVPLREAMINELAQYIGIEAATKLADDWAGGRYGNEGYVFPYDEFGINNDRGVGARGLDDWVQVRGTPFLDEGGQPELRESSYGGVGSTARPDEWSVYIRAIADVWKAEQEVTRIKKLRLYEIADEMNRDRSARDFETSGYALPVLARAIAYATNPNLLTADLRLRDRYASEMEAGLPYEGAPPRLIPIPKELLENLRRADRDVAKQEKKVASLRKQGSLEQRRMVRGRLKGIGKIVERPDGTVEGQMLKGPQTKAELEIEQLRNKDLNKQIRLDQLREQFAVQSGMLADVAGVRQSASAVGEYMAQPIGPQLGVDANFGYLPGGLPSTARDASRVMTELRLEGAAPQVKSPTSMLRTSDIMPLRLDDMMKRFDEIRSVVGRNRVLEEMVMDPRVSIRMSSLVTPEQYNQIVQKAQNDVARQQLVRTPTEVDAVVRSQVGIQLFEIARRNGYEAVSPVKVDPVTGAHEALGDLLRTVSSDQIDPNTILMRIGMREKLTQQFVPRASSNMPDAVQSVGNTLGKFTSEWKTTVLPFSGRWQIGDFVGNVMNAWALADVPPAELFQRMLEVDSLLTSSSKRLESLTGTIDNDLISVLIGAGLQARGTRDFDLQQMRGLNPRAAIPDYQIQGPIPKLRDVPGLRMFPGFREKSFRFNEYQNTVARAATASILLERTLNQRGLTIDSVTALNYIDDANIRDAVNKAVRDTNEALGAFSELNPFEKNVVRNIYPFWSWIRYINKAAAKMAIDHPDRVLFTAALGSIASSPEQEGLFPFLEGRVPMLGYYFDLSFLNPYQDAIILQPNPFKAASEQFQNISPTITAPIRAGSATLYYLGAPQINVLGGNVQRPGYLEGQGSLLTGNVSTTRTAGDLLGELGYLGLTTMGGPFRNLPAFGPTGERIPGTDIALGNVQRFPQGSARTEGRYAVQRLSRPAQIAGALLGTFGVPKPIIEQDVAEEQATLQSIKDIQARQRRERERILSRIGQ